MNFLRDCVSYGSLCARRVGSLSRASAKALAPLAAILLLVPGLLSAWAVGSAWENAEGFTAFVALAELAFLRPCFYAAAAYVCAARWEHRKYDLASAFTAVKANIWRVLGTGVAVWLASMLLDSVASIVGSLLSMVYALLAWVPVLGKALYYLSFGVGTLIGYFVDFACAAALIYALVALLGDGMWGNSQIRRTLALLWGGRRDGLPALVTIFAASSVVRALCDLATYFLAGGIYWAAVVGAARVAFVAVAVVVVCLTERDRQDGRTMIYAADADE